MGYGQGMWTGFGYGEGMVTADSGQGLVTDRGCGQRVVDRDGVWTGGFR